MTNNSSVMAAVAAVCCNKEERINDLKEIAEYAFNHRYDLPIEDLIEDNQS